MGTVVVDKITERPVYLDYAPKNWAVADKFDSVELKMDGQLGRMELSDGTVLLGEYLFGSNWAYRNGMEGQFWAFDVLQLFGKDYRTERFSVRKLALEKIAFALPSVPYQIWSRRGQLKGEGHDASAIFKLVQTYPLREAGFLWDQYVVDKGYEGLVFKHSDHAYGTPWGRMKKVLTMDYVVVGFNPSTAKTKAGKMVQSIQAGLIVNGVMKVVANIGGLDHALSSDMFKDPGKYLGRVFEAEGKDLFESGALRHPNFLRFRDDKDPKECKL